MIGFLRATSGPHQGDAFTLGARTLVGRSGDADIQLSEKAVSRRHALVLRLDDDRYWIGDLASTNGTFLGVRRVESHCLKAGDEIHLGKSTLVYGEAMGAAEVEVSPGMEELHLLSGPAEFDTKRMSMSALAATWKRHRRLAREGAPDTNPLDFPEFFEGPRSSPAQPRV